MVEFGMKPVEAIRTATVEAADLLGWRARRASSLPAPMPT